jgi:hypothetical protein
LQSSLASSTKLPSSYSIEIWFRVEPNLVAAEDEAADAVATSSSSSSSAVVAPLPLVTMLGERNDVVLSLRLTVDRMLTFASSGAGNESISTTSAIS